MDGARDETHRFRHPDERVATSLLDSAEGEAGKTAIERERLSSRRPDPDHEWWVTGYDLTPEAKQFFEGAAEVTARVAIEVGYVMLVCAREAGRCACH